MHIFETMALTGTVYWPGSSGMPEVTKLTTVIE